MARRIKRTDIHQHCKGQMEKLMRAAVLETDSLLKQASPVDTGRFRASWQVGENSAPGGIVAPGKYGKIAPIQRLGYGQEKPGNIYSIHNNLPYAEPLAGGPSFPPSWIKAGVTGSRQTAPGWIQMIAKDVQGRVLLAAARIGRES
jgi:hypothetical protein